MNVVVGRNCEGGTEEREKSELLMKEGPTTRNNSKVKMKW